MKTLRGLDTNILLRALTGDDSRQSPAARALLEEAEGRGERFHVSVPVLCELVWTLRGGRYRLERQTIAGVLERIVQTPLFEIQHRDPVHLAIEDYRSGAGDFSDYLIGRLDEAVGCARTVTFDGALKDGQRFEVLGY
jgi:predicted nucleic-acid-binding protein